MSEGRMADEVSRKIELAWLTAFYGGLLTDKQRQVLALHCEEDLSLAEIAQELGVSRQGVFDNLSRAEALLRNMEEKTGCVSRDLACRKAAKQIMEAALQLREHSDPNVSALAECIASAAANLEE